MVLFGDTSCFSYIRGTMFRLIIVSLLSFCFCPVRGQMTEIEVISHIVHEAGDLNEWIFSSAQLHGDDPSTDAIEGLQVGEELHFEVRGERAEQSLVYSGQMDIKHLALTFGAAQAMASVFPNPFVESLQVSAVVETPGYLDVRIDRCRGQGRGAATHGLASQRRIQWDMGSARPRPRNVHVQNFEGR